MARRHFRGFGNFGSDSAHIAGPLIGGGVSQLGIMLAHLHAKKNPKALRFAALHGAEFAIIPDRLEAGTYLLAGAATGGDVRVTNAVPHHMDSLVAKLREMGMRIETGEAGIRAISDGPLQAGQVQAVPYPGFATDLHPQIAAAMTQAQGISIVHERVYDNRTLYVNELRKLGARIVTGGDLVIMEGPTRLAGSAVRALDIRAGAAVVVAGLAADGETTVHGIGHLDRGYADLEPRLRGLGAEIERR